MKNKLLSFFLFLCSSSAIAQVIYSDEFNEGINSTTPPASYTTGLINNNLQIVGNGTAGAYEAINYDIHNSGVATSIDLSSNAKFFIKAKGTGLPVLRIDLADNNGYVTNLMASQVNLENDYIIFQIDYTGKFTDGGYGGPCGTSGTCPVNASNIQNILFMVNAATGNYNGTIDIEWISFGEALELPPPTGHEIRYNQVGYFKDRNKYISINSDTDFSGVAYTIEDSSNNVVMSGNNPPTSFWGDANQYVSVIDITPINTSDTYTVTTVDDQISFTVSDTPYDNLVQGAFKYYYYNRVSSAVTAPYGGAWTRNSGHPDTNIIVHSSAASVNRPTGTIISAPKGWYDAGDYNKYIVNSGISTYTLLAAFEHYKSYYENRDFNIPESGDTLPDILDEVLWNLEWMLDMQDNVAGGGDGGVYHKLTALGFSARTTMPENYTLDRYVVQKTTAAALNFAAVTAVASRIFEDYAMEKPGLSATLLAASKDAYTWAANNPTVYYNQPADVSTGEYGDTNVTDEFQWAATELFITTGEVQYKNDININSIDGGIPGWQFSDPLALISIAFHGDDLQMDLDVTAVENKILASANAIKSAIENSAMQIGMSTSEYQWGSNGNASNQTLLLLRAYEISADISFLEAAYKGMDYILGRNGTGTCYVSGYGDKPVLRPHHRISEGDGVGLPVPGMVAGGPHTLQPEGDCTYTENDPATSYLDDWCSYSTNEITINWNAPFVYAVNALKFYQDSNIILSNSSGNDKSINNALVLYPNPADYKLSLNKTGQYRNQNVMMTLYDVRGKKLLSTLIDQNTQTINIEQLQTGLYFAELRVKGETITKKIIKK